MPDEQERSRDDDYSLADYWTIWKPRLMSVVEWYKPKTQNEYKVMIAMVAFVAGWVMFALFEGAVVPAIREVIFLPFMYAGVLAVTRYVEKSNVK